MLKNKYCTLANLTMFILHEHVGTWLIAFRITVLKTTVGATLFLLMSVRNVEPLLLKVRPAGPSLTEELSRSAGWKTKR